MFDADTKKVYIKQSDGKITDAATGAPVASLPDSADNVRLNNKLRRHVDAALAGLTLLSPDVGMRIAAARTVFKSHEESALPLVEEALAKETNAGAKAALAQARAAILLFKSDATEEQKLKAVAVVRARGDQEALAVLNDIGASSRRALPRRRRARSPRSRTCSRSGRRCRMPGRAVARLGAAARSDRSCHHLRRDGRHQHGARRDGDVGAYATFVVQEVIRAYLPAPVRLFAVDRGAAGFPGGRCDRDRDRTHHHPLPLRPSAGNAAGDLGSVAGVTAGGAHDLRRRPTARSAVLPG